jgi:quercetin dioxygenase-like cupin family protein
MAYAPSPRPAFDRPSAIPRASVTRHLWGDATSGFVADWIYVSSDQIHQLEFGLGLGGSFKHSDEFRTIFAADEVLYVLEGAMTIANPETGEVHLVEQGEAAFFQRDTWHHAWNAGVGELRVLELFAPPPSQGTSGSYARTKPMLEQVSYRRDSLIGSWPGANAAASTIKVIQKRDWLWRMEDAADATLVGILASTEQLTVGYRRLLPGQQSSAETHGGAESLYVLRGTLHVGVVDASPPSLYELAAGDGFYLPQGEAHRYLNMSGEPVEFLFGVAPHYLERTTA